MPPRMIEAALGPALGVVELSSIARGMVVADAMVKRAPVRLLDCHPVSPGKYLIVVSGPVAEVDEAMQAATAAAAHTLVDRLFLAQAHPALEPALTGALPLGPVDAVGIIETLSVATTVLAADAAAKTADVALVRMRLANGLGGKAFFTMTGTLADIEAALAAGIAVAPPGFVLASEIIPAPHQDLVVKLCY